MSSLSDFKCDVCVIGKGLLGSAAARHLSEMGVSVLLLGPDEPKVRSDHSGVFGSHYDSGRITRIIDTDLYCAQIAEASISRYAELEKFSGIDFFEPVGHLAVSNLDNYISKIVGTARHLGVDAKSLAASELASRFSYFSFPSGVSGVHEHSTGGHINPRNLIKAQIEMLMKAENEVVNETGSAIERHDGFFRVVTQNGKAIKANKVLLASGVFSERLVDSREKLDLEICESTVVLAELGKEDAERLRGMPSVIFRQEAEYEKGVYLLPPIRYPDGKTYIKIGHSESRPMSDPDANLVKWFQGKGDPVIADWLKSQLFSLLPGVSFTDIKTESCAVSRSPTGRQFIDTIEGSGIHVLLAGNGYSAKSSDELGRIAAHKVISGEVPEEYSDIDFKVKYKRT
ncbi:MAG: FAD-dependent oxidoreductase [Actinobacteria bacterium]|nr:FAD-dependent oxidoreductase [Actinomycetota bacterium]